jgi:TP901 family phage tail tape measure protein
MASENVVTNIVASADFSDLISNVNKVNLQLSQLKQTLTSTDKALALNATKIQQGFASTLRSTGQFSTHFVNLTADVDKFGKNLDQGRLKLKEYYGVWQQHSRTSGGLIRDLARQQVALQNAIVQPLGRNAEGLMQFNVNIPRGLDETKNKTALLKQEMQIFNKVIQDGGVQLINWGKNTQWAGRQLTVGLTVPIAAFGKAAADAFREADEQLVRLTKVYGGIAGSSAAELATVRKEVAATAKELAAQYGASYKETIALSADIAATGKEGAELLNSVRETTRLSVLGEVDRQEAMKATLAIQTAFNQNTQELAESINFLNAVENQTSTTLNDLVEAIPKAGPVVKSLGGDIEDLALYLTAMKEGGINASEGANAIKSSLASLINPTKVAKEMFMGFGINLEQIVTSNAGNLTATILDLQKALDTLDPLSKTKAIEQLFGKFQFARLSALFDNLGRQGSQTLQVLDLMNASVGDLASVAGRELAQITESASGRFRRALEQLKADLAGVGEQFLNVGTFFINLVDKIVNFANKLPGPIKTLMSLFAGFTALAGPIIMLTGVLANFLGYVIKGAAHFRAFFKGGEGWRLLTPEILAAQKAGNLAEQTFYNDAKAAMALGEALSYVNDQLTQLQTKAGSATISSQPTISTIAGQTIIAGAREVVPSHPLVSDRDTRSFSHPNPVSQMTPEQKAAQTIFGIVPGAPLVNQKISNNPQMYMSGDLPKVEGVSSIRGVSTGIVAEEAAKWHAMTGALAMQSKEEIALLKREVAATGLITTSLSDSYQALLPEMSRLTSLAAFESAQIVADLQASKITVEQARARVIALNQQIEAMMGQAATGVATAQGRTINLTQFPIVDQPAFDPVTGKSNMKELTRPRNRGLITRIAQALRVKTFGAPYSTETTRPRRLNMGGQVFTTEQGRFVPGQGNTDTVPAMLTPGEFVVTKEQTARDPEGLHLYNKGKAVIVPIQNRNKGGMIDGMQFFGRMMPNRIVKGLSTTRNRDIVETVHGIKARGADARGFISQIGDIPDPVLKQKYLDVAKNFTNNLTRSKKDPALHSQTSRTLQSKNVSELNSRFAENGLDPLPYAEPRHATHMTVSKKLGDGKVLVSSYVVDYTAATNLSANQNNLRPSDFLRRDLIKVAGVNKYRNQLRAAKIPLSQWDEAEQAIDSAIRTRFENEAQRRGVSVDQLPTIGDRPELGAEFTFTKDVIPEIERVLTQYNPTALYERDYLALKENKELRVQRKNMGGIIQNFGTNMVGRIVKSLSRSKLDKLTAKWKPQMQFRKPGYQYTLGNQDPLHGPLQIGTTMVPKNMQNEPAWTREILYRDDRFARQAVLPQFPVGNLEDRGKYILRQYMAGNYGILQTPGATEAVKTLSRKFTGRLYRGIFLKNNKSNPLPADILDLISQAKLTGDYTPLIGREFIMRRSSWSQNRDVASLFAPGHSAPGIAGEKAILLEALVKNRNVVPASDIFPDATFSAPFGQKVTGHNSRSEQESIFGGKFRIVSADNGTLKLETVVDGARAMGGPVNGGRPYLVGENGPEIFVPKMSGGIIPGFSKGGVVPGVQYFAEENEQRIVQPRTGQFGYMKSMLLGQAAGFGLSQVGGKMFGGIGQMGGYMVGQVATDMFLMSRMAGRARSETTLLTKAMEFFSKMPGPVKLIAVLLGVGTAIKTINDKINERRRIINSAFGPEEETVKKLNLDYKTLSESIEENRKEIELRNAAAAAFKYTTTKVPGQGIDITQKELDELKKQVKEQLPTELKMLNIASEEEAAQKATQLKAILVSSGKSVEEANEIVLALIQVSNKASQELSILGDKGFGSITDKASAAKSTLETFNNVIKNGNTDQLSKSLDTALNAYNNLADSIENTKDKNGKLITSSEAYQEILKKIKETSGGNVAIGLEGVNAIVKQNAEMSKLVNTTDTLASIMAKVKLSTSGIALDFINMGPAAAEALSIIIEKQREALKSGPYSQIVKDMAKVSKSNADQIIKNAEVSAKALEKEIALHNKKIQKIKEEADARKKALDEENADEDINLKIKAKQLEYQDKLAAGDMSGAAQAQIAIQQLVGSQQVTLAKRAIDLKAEQDIAAEQSSIDALNARIDGLQNKIDGAKKTADAAAAKTENLGRLLNELIALTTSATDGPLDAKEQDRLKLLISDLEKAGYKDIAQSISGSGGSYVGSRFVPNTSGIEEIAKSAFGKAIYNEKGELKTTDTEVSALLKRILSGTPLPTTGTGLSFDRESGGYRDRSTGVKYTPEQARVIPVPIGGPAGTNRAFVHPEHGGGKSIEMLGPIKDLNKNGYLYKKNGDVLKNGQLVGRWYNPGHNNPGSNFTFAQGGSVRHYGPGGDVIGPGTATSDSIPAYLSNGEYVIKASSVEKYGTETFDALNAGRFANGGKVTKMGTADSMIKTAESMLGYKEGRGNDTIFGRFAQKAYDLQTRYIAWCGAFINWAAKNSGVDLASMIWTPGGAQSFMKSGKWTTMSPVRGDLAFMDFPGDGVNRISHVGLVRKVLSKNAVSTIEGNTSGSGSQRSGGGVLAKVRQYNMKNAPIVGFGRPSYKPVDTIKYGYGTPEYYSADDAKSDYENERYTVGRGDTLSAIAAKYGISVKQLMEMNPQLNDPKYMGGSRIFAGTKVNIKKFAQGGKVTSSFDDSGNWIKGPLTVPRQKKPGVPYSRSGKPIGNPFGQYWGELSRFIGPRSPGMDIWGGTEIPGLKFSGNVPQHSDYMHQMAEQPRKPFTSPGMGVDKDPMRLAGSGASMGGIGSGAYGFGPLMFAGGGRVINPLSDYGPSRLANGGMARMFHAGGPVGHTHSSAPHAMGMSSMGSVSSALKQKMESSSGRRSGRRRLPAGHMASNYKAPKSVAQKIYDNFLFPAILSLDRVQAAFTGTNPIASTNIEGLKSQQEKIKQQGVASVFPEIAAQVGLDFGSFLLPAAAGNASIRGLAEGYGLSKGLPGLGSLLPKGSIPYATSAVPQFTSNAITAAMIGAARPFAENKISSMIQKPQVKISADDFKPNSAYPPFVIHEGKNVPVFSGSGFGNDAVVFQGGVENLSSLLANHQVTDIIPTTPEGILSYILKKDPSHKKAKSLLDKMNSGYQWADKDVKEFMMNMLASGSINLKKVASEDLVSPQLFGLRRPELSESLDPAGLAQLISAMRGNTRDEVAIKTKTKAISPLLTKMVQEYIENVRLQQESVAATIAGRGGPKGGLYGYAGEQPLTKAEIAAYKAQGLDPYTPPTPRDIPMIRIFNDDFPSTDGAGDLFEKDAATHILARFFGPKGLPEGTVGTPEQLHAAITSRHFAAHDAVQSHFQGSWKPNRPFIVSTLSNLMKYNGKPEQLHSVDSFFLQRFGKPFHYSKKEGELSSGFPLEEAAYIAKLKELNLYKPGEAPPIIAEDLSAKEIFYLDKEKYSQAELAQILQAVNENGNLKPIQHTDNTMGRSEEFYMPKRNNYESDQHLSASRILQILAIDKAKKQIGIDEKYMYATGGEFSSLNQDVIKEMAAKLGIRFDGGHNATDIANLAHGSGANPFEYILNRYRAQTGQIGVGISDTQKALGALLMFTRFGKYTSGKTYADEDDLLAAQKSAVGLYARGALSEKDFMSIISKIKEQLKNAEEAAGGGFVNNGKIQIPKFASGGYANPSNYSNMSVPSYAMGGLAGPKYNIPTNTVSLGKNQIPGYNKGGAVHHYDVGGFVVNAQPGQDERMIASMVVDMLDQKNVMRAAMSGVGRRN